MINGYAYSPNSEKIKSERIKRFGFLKKLGHISIEYKQEKPGTTHYKGWCDNSTEEDVCIYCDSGHVPFGGKAIITNGHFECVIYND